MRIGLIVAVAAVSAMATACGPGQRAGTGTVVGAVAGGIIGNQVGSGGGRVAATAIGAVAGGIIGHEIGRSLDEADRRRAVEAEYQALEYGETGSRRNWRNPDSGHHGYIVPEKPYMADSRHCRRFTHTIYIDGRPETMRGTACRQSDGTWRNVG